MRVLMLATYFPKPGRDTIGPWALDQAVALKERGTDVKVVSLTPWLPPLFKSEAGRAISDCPRSYKWGNVEALYPKWLYYHMQPIRRLSYPNPKPFLQIAYATARKKLLEIVDEFSPDVIFAHHSAVNGYVAAQIKRERGIPFVVTDHSHEDLEDCYRYPGRRKVTASVASQAARMVSVCHRMEKTTTSLFPAAKTRTVLNGIPCAPACGQLKSTPKPSKSNCVIFSAGIFYPRKSFPFLIDVFATVSRKHPECLLRIAGDGVEREMVVQRIRAHGLEQKVSLLGLLPRDKVLAEHAEADIFALLGHDEPFGVVFGEAMAAGKPIVCSSDGGITDIAVSELHLLSFPPRDPASAAAQLIRLVEDPSLRRVIGDAGNALFLESLTSATNAEKMLNIFSEVITEHQLNLAPI